MKTPFLVACDYGQGAVWPLNAPSHRAKWRWSSPELTVVDTPPNLDTDAELAKVRAVHTYDIDEDRTVGG